MVAARGMKAIYIPIWEYVKPNFSSIGLGQFCGMASSGVERLALKPTPPLVRQRAMVGALRCVLIADLMAICFQFQLGVQRFQIAPCGYLALQDAGNIGRELN